MQRFLNLSPWDVDALLDLNREYAMEHRPARVGSLSRIRPGSPKREPSQWAYSGSTPGR
jgi:hypothetical protein